LKNQELTSEKIHRATAYRGSKSAFDAVNLVFMTGKKVDCVLRDVNGPGMTVFIRRRGVHGVRLAERWKDILASSIFSTESF